MLDFLDVYERALKGPLMTENDFDMKVLVPAAVLPTPVGPIKIILLGIISSLISSFTCCLRHLFLKAIATARLASS